jgi:hypothetical protein
MKRILMIANDNERWGPARLPEPLSKAGVEVAVLCPADNPLSQSSFVNRHYSLDKLQSWRTFGRRFGAVMAEWKPDFIIPCDEMVVVMLHYFLKWPRPSAHYLDAGQLSVLRHSIGNIDRLDAMVLKHQTRLMAESLGVRVPKSTFVKTPEQAEKVAVSMGFPVFLKVSFSWAGQGAIQCDNAEQLRKTFNSLRKKTSWVKLMARYALARDWYPSESDIEVQQSIAGESVMYNVVALNGKMLGGLYASRVVRTVATGPSTAVAIGENPVCRTMAGKMIAAMGASGFLAFDFMKCQHTSEMFLLECNPRPNQIFHLGNRVGSDLCQVLADGLHGRVQATSIPTGDAIVPLFPQAWFHDETSALAEVSSLDVPKNDPKLLDFMLRHGQGKGKASGHLLDHLKLQGLVPPHYTFG